MALNYDVFDHIQSYITCRKDLLASMMTCRMLYNSGIPYLLRHFPIALTNYISIESFCRFMLSDPTRFLLFHRLQLKFDTYDSEDNDVHWDPTLSFRRLKELWIQSMNYISAEDLIRLFPNVERMAIVGNWDYPINRDASNLWHAINREAFQNDSQAWGSLSHLWGNSRELFCLAYPRQVNNLSIQKLEDTPNLSRTQYILHCFQPKCLQIVVCTFHTPPFEGTSTLTLLVDLILSMENSDAWKRLRKLCIIIRVRPKFDLMTDFRNTNPDFSKVFKNLSITHLVIKVAIDRNDAPWHISPPIEVADLDLSKEFPAKWLAGRILRDAKSTLEYLNISLHYVDNSVDAELSSYIPLITRFWKIVQGRDKRQLQEIPISVGEKFMHVDGFQFGLPGVITSWL
ncbi:hypothetical protein C8Q75DRAFT_488904 [Abortiporus biennis]|nr:hypothetical protein C8Q75DRAFT_488904 [Abortiporus biennis]